MGKKIVRVHSAITVMEPSLIIGEDGKDTDICEFAADFPVFPMPEHHFNKAFEDMRLACLEKARGAGLVRA